MNFRDYHPADRAACLSILKSNRPEYFSEDDEQEFASFLDDLPGPYIVLEHEGEPVAGGGWASEQDGSVSLTWGLVHRDHHRAGMGSKLLAYRIEMARGMADLPIIRLNTIPLVVPFFERAGFQTTSVEPDGFGPGYDKVSMQLAF